MRKYFAEFFGTFVLVLFGTGVAVVSGGNLVATSLAFGLAIVAGAYSLGSVSGCHVNPAVSLAMLISKRMNLKDFWFYLLFQVLGAITGTAVLVLVLNSTDYGTASLGANFYGEMSANSIGVLAAFFIEVVLTCVFVYTILGVTKEEKNSAVAGIVIGLTLTFVHLIGIPLTGTSVNPARSLAPAIFLCGDALKQVWLFILAPLVGGSLAAVIHKYLNVEEKPKRK